MAAQLEGKIVLICTGNIIAYTDLHMIGAGYPAIVSEFVQDPDTSVQEIIWHFSPADSSVIANMPENYDDYIERMDSAVEAYMRRIGMPDEEVVELRRPDID